jgi:hypothetical protein
MNSKLMANTIRLVRKRQKNGTRYRREEIESWFSHDNHGCVAIDEQTPEHFKIQFIVGMGEMPCICGGGQGKTLLVAPWGSDFGYQVRCSSCSRRGPVRAGVMEARLAWLPNYTEPVEPWHLLTEFERLMTKG